MQSDCISSLRGTCVGLGGRSCSNFPASTVYSPEPEKEPFKKDWSKNHLFRVPCFFGRVCSVPGTNTTLDTFGMDSDLTGPGIRVVPQNYC